MKIRALIMAVLLMMSFTACSFVKAGEVNPSQNVSQEEGTGDRSLEELKAQYPEYFELSSFKGIELYIWEMSEDSFRCGMMSGTNRNKTDEEIWDLANKSLSITEAKKILEYQDIKYQDVIVMPVIQPVSSYQYEINDEYWVKLKKAFDDNGMAVNIILE